MDESSKLDDIKVNSEKTQSGEREDSETSEPSEEKSGTFELALKQAEEAKKEMLYVKAEFDNYRKRILKEQEQSIRFANRELIIELLNIVDYLDRAIQHSKILKSKSDAEVVNFVTGVEMSQHEFLQLLNRFGVEFVGKVGEAFDPEKHEAIGQQPSEKNKAGQVLEVFQRGGSLNGRLIKPAKVIVSQ